MVKHSRATFAIAAAVFGMSMITPGWAQKSYPGRISDMSTESNSDSLMAPGSIKADSATITSSSQTHGRLLTRSEGLALIKVALTQPESPDDQPDCSHLVHQIYEVGGLDYPYSPSFTLYDGITEFQRVSSPQPGDLVVWQGHVGVVVDPVEHSFYSSVGSGFETENYESNYWRGRGPSRFYRYLVGAASDVATLQKSAQRSTAKVPNEESDSEKDAQPPASTLTASRGSTELRRPATKGNDLDSAKMFTVPESISIPSGKAKPVADDVNEAVSELTNASSGALRSENLTASSTVVIFDQLRVEKIEIKRDKGWAEVRFDYRVQLNQGQLQTQHHSEKKRWELRRTQDRWTVVKPADRIYIPAEVAEQVVSERLYKLTRKSSDKNHGEQATLARLLDAVLN